MSWKPLEWLGNCLEWLARYGLIDILLGIGIVGYFRQFLRRPIVDHIDGLEIGRKFQPSGGYFEIKLLNLSGESLYVYRSYFAPYFVEPGRLLLRQPLAWFKFFRRRKLPSVARSESQTVRGEYVLVPLDQTGNPLKSAFIQRGDSIYYRVHLENGSAIITEKQAELDQLLLRRECGTITLHCVHGTTPRVLKTRV